jgi:4,5-DOPA dioxygenase extradiol
MFDSTPADLAGPPRTVQRQPVLYLSHGAPPLADDPTWTRELADWSAGLPRPTAILVVSAHWEAAPLTVSATTTVPLLHDFWGFPERYYPVGYPAPGAPALAASVAKLLARPGQELHSDRTRGLDHGAYVPLVQMFPAADVPVLQLSMPSLDPQELFDVGRRLAPLRDEGVLVIGSGFTTHNLREARFGDLSGSAPAWGHEFDQWARDTVEAGDVDAVLDFRHRAPAAAIAHPRSDHFAPLFVSLGAATGDPSRSGTGTAIGTSMVDGFWYGMAKRSFQFG